MTNAGEYLYCITRFSGERVFDSVSAIGDPGAAVRMVGSNGLAAVVSASPAEEYESTRANMLAHQRVIERVMRESTLLPVCFGTVAVGPSSASAIEKLLRGKASEFDGLLTELEDRVELGLKALWRDDKEVMEKVVAENEDIGRLRISLQGKPPAATHFDRIRLGEKIKVALDRKRRAEGEALLAPLRALAYRTVENPIVADRVIVNAAFLVDRARELAFDDAVSRLDGDLGHRIVLKYVGPVPPYNFVNITVNWQGL